MREEPTERDRRLARAVVNSDWFADQLATARREGAAEVAARVEALADEWSSLPGRPESWWRVGTQLGAALRGDAWPNA